LRITVAIEKIAEQKTKPSVLSTKSSKLLFSPNIKALDFLISKNQRLFTQVPPQSAAPQVVT